MRLAPQRRASQTALFDASVLGHASDNRTELVFRTIRMPVRLEAIAEASSAA